MNPRLSLVPDESLAKGLQGLRERLDAELRLIHGRFGQIEDKLNRLEERIGALEGRTYIPPEIMYAIESELKKP